jgi:hypothetical protein
MARRAQGNRGSVVAKSASPLNGKDSKIFHAPARLTMPSISLQSFAAEEAISFRFKPQAGPLCSGSSSLAHIRVRELEDVPTCTQSELMSAVQQGT